MDRPPIGLNHPSPGYGKSEQGLRCPRCQGPLIRVRRQPVDRLISLISPRRRYRCAAIGCGWEGTRSAKR
jgi:uncharacterized protein with PIN domain